MSMLPRPVLSKLDYYARWQKQEFGNKLRSWQTVEDIAPYTGLITMRHIDPSSNLTRYEVKVADITTSAMDILSNYRFNESAPDSKLLAQGEVCASIGGWQVVYSKLKTNMRKALAEAPIYVAGLAAKETLKYYCCPSSYADLEVLLELYPDHVIEFGCYSQFLGNVAHRNTIIWEVRKY